MKLAEQIFIAVMMVLGIVLVAFLLAPTSRLETVKTISPSIITSFITKTMVVPAASASAEEIIPFDENMQSRGKFGGSSSSRSAQETHVVGCLDPTASNFNPDADIAGHCTYEEPCDDENNNGICDSEEISCPDINNNGICDNEEIPCLDQNTNGICDSDEVPPCVDANSNGICDEEEMPPCPDANNNNICDTEEIP
ncbi:MAG: hypothetical protein Q7K45_06115, partial [Nanoarchaeota archaeon]|nr:hypothetical protein [Nanoarchaeota archaeon]